MKPVIPRKAADDDIDRALSYYRGHAAEVPPNVAARFLQALEAAFDAIATRPGMGSPRYAHELDMPGLRSWIVDGFPYLVFYMEHDNGIDVLRVLHQSRDIPAGFDSR